MKKIIPFVWKYLMQQKVWLFLTIISLLLAFVTPLFAPILYKDLINIAALGLQSGTVEQLYSIAWKFVIVVVVMQLGWKTLEIWIIPLETRICRQIYLDGFSRMMQQSNQFFTQNFSGSIVKKISRLVDKMEGFIDLFVYQISRIGISIITMTVVLWFENRTLGILVFIWMIAVIIAKKYLWSWKLKFNEAVAREDSKVSARLSDAFTNALTVITCGMQKRELDVFTQTVNGWYKVWKRSWWIDNGIFFVSTIFIVVLQLGTIFGAIYLWSHGSIQVGTFVLLISYLTIFVDQVVEINFMYRNLFRTVGDMTEAIDMMQEPVTIVDAKGATPLKATKGEIVFDHVNFSYNEGSEEVLKDFHLTVHPGEKIALVGVSGSGKSTVLKLLFRLYDVTKGAIMVDGQEISKVTQDSLRQSMSMVPQDPVLFHRTIGENISYAAENPTQKDIENAATHAHAAEFIQKLSKGYNTVVGERGVKLSGGERQRVALARSILANKRILVLDEATSALDSESEKCIQESLHDVMEGRTAIVIAHRLSTIMQMDRIIVMEKGKIAEEGTHKELIKKKNGVYKKLWEIQTGEFIKDV